MKYFDNRKHKMFPEITDWTAGYLDKRYPRDVKSQSYKEWFFFSPANFWICNFSYPILSMLIFGFATYWFLAINTIVATIAAIIAIYQVFTLVKKVKLYKRVPTCNFYDLWMRERT